MPLGEVLAYNATALRNLVEKVLAKNNELEMDLLEADITDRVTPPPS